MVCAECVACHLFAGDLRDGVGGDLSEESYGVGCIQRVAEPAARAFFVDGSIGEKRRGL